jgi:hypothetical protein
MSEYVEVLRIANHSIRRSWVVYVCIGRSLYPPRKQLPYAVEEEADGPQSQSGGCSCRESNTGYPVVQPVT